MESFRRRVLVVANRTAATPDLLDAVHRYAVEQPTTFSLLIPDARKAEHADWTLERGYPLSPDLLAMSHVWKSPTGEDYVLAAKGAPEAVADLCHLDAERTKAVGIQVAAMAQDGLRVLGVARGVFRQQKLPGDQHDFTFEFLGLVGLADPVRPTVTLLEFG